MIIKQKNAKFIANEFQAVRGYEHYQVWTAPLLGVANRIRVSTTLVATNTQTFLLNTYSFTVTSASATKDAVYTDSNKGNLFTVVATIAGATTLVLTTATPTSGVVAASTAGTLTKVSGTGDATIAYSTHAAVVVLGQPDFPRNVTITPTKGSGSAITGNVVVTGTDIRGNAITDTIACGTDTTLVNGVLAFSTITSITFPARTQASDAIVVGTGAYLGADRIIQFPFIAAGMVASTSAAIGVIESSAPTLTAALTISGSLIKFNTSALDGSSYFIAKYHTFDVTSNQNVTS